MNKTERNSLNLFSLNKLDRHLEWYVIGVAAAIAALSIRLKVGVAASVAASVFARPELVTTYRYIHNARLASCHTERLTYQGNNALFDLKTIIYGEPRHLLFTMQLLFLPRDFAGLFYFC